MLSVGQLMTLALYILCALLLLYALARAFCGLCDRCEGMEYDL